MRHLRLLGHCMAAGALFGGLVAPLQLLLWPELRLSAGAALLALLAWASWGAFWAGTIPFLIVELTGLFVSGIGVQRGFRLPLWWPLALSTGLGVAAIAWWNREQSRDLLVPDHRDALSAVMTISLLFAIVSAITGRRAAVSRHPIARAALPAAGVLAAVWTVWASSAPSLPPPMPPRTATPPFPRKVMLLSWEGADLAWLLPAMEQGDMPFLRSRRDRGAWGQLRTLRPYSRSAFFATLATACSPAVHGVIGRRAYRLRWLSETPVSLMLIGPWPLPHHLPWRAWELAAPPPSRRAQLWEILSRAGLRVGVAGWPGLVRASWSVPQPNVAEAKPYETLDAGLQASLEPLLAAHPELAGATRNAFAIAASLEAAAQERLAAGPVEAYVLNTDLPARLRPLWTFDVPTAPQAEVLRAAARLLDADLKQAWSELGGEDVVLVVVSPYGLNQPSAWRRLWSSASQRSRWRVSPSGSPDGFVLLSGPGVKQGVRLRGARLADVTATVLYLLDLPVARDMWGRVLLDAIGDERVTDVPLRLIPSYGPPVR